LALFGRKPFLKCKWIGGNSGVAQGEAFRSAKEWRGRFQGLKGILGEGVTWKEGKRLNIGLGNGPKVLNYRGILQKANLLRVKRPLVELVCTIVRQRKIGRRGHLYKRRKTGSVNCTGEKWPLIGGAH